jgi:hypothetical protein
MPVQAIKSERDRYIVVLVHPDLALNRRLSRKVRMTKSMTESRISTTALSGAVQVIRKSNGTNAGVMRGTILMLFATLLAVSPLPVSAGTPDPVLEWIGVMNTTVLAAGTPPNVTGRVVALVSASVFDAVNGIEPRFRPLHVSPDAPHNASQRAAAIQAAYVILLNLYPAQSGILTTQRNASLAAPGDKLSRTPSGPGG